MKTKYGSVVEAAHQALENDDAYVVLLVNSRKREEDILAFGGVPGGTVCVADEDTPENIAGYCAQYNGKNELIIVVDDFATLSWPVIQVLQGYYANGVEVIIDG